MGGTEKLPDLDSINASCPPLMENKLALVVAEFVSLLKGEEVVVEPKLQPAHLCGLL